MQDAQQVKFKRKTTSEIENLEIEDGSLIYNVENGKTYMDYGSNRVQTGGNADTMIAIGNTEPTDTDVKLWIEPDSEVMSGYDDMKYRDSNNEFQHLELRPTGDTLPIGTVIEYAGETIPYGWLRCDGSLLNASTYPELFDAIGTIYNQPNDENGYFRLPNRKGRVGVGLDTNDTDFDTIGKTGGEKTHTHVVPIRGVMAYENTDGLVYSSGGTIPKNNITSNDGSSLQPYQVSNFIIKVKQAVGIVGTVANEYNENNNTVYDSNYINNTSSYSTTESFTGKHWIDGKPIYRKVVYIPEITNTEITVNTGITNIGCVTSMSGSFRRTINSVPYFYSIDNMYLNEWRINATTGNMTIGTNTSNVIYRENYLVFEYTKAS